jgi:3-hydroxyacyl-[acyl-carrier-protein] dehydratase
MILDLEGIKQFLPHREPFLFVDSLEKVTLPEESLKKTSISLTDLIGGSTHCRFAVKTEMEILRGHFPGKPIMPGVIQVEMMAQSASFLCMHQQLYKGAKQGIDVALLGVDSARFRKPIYPGMVLDISSVLKKARGSILNFDCEIYCEGELMSQAQVLASIKL